MQPLAPSLLFCFCALAAPVTAQTFLAQVGSELVPGETILSVSAHAVGSGGDWIAEVVVDAPSPTSNQRLVVNGVVRHTEGDPLPGPDQLRVGVWPEVAINIHGEFVARGMGQTASGTPVDIVSHEGQLVMRTGESVSGPIPGGTTIDSILGLAWSDSRVLLAHALLSVPGLSTPQHALLERSFNGFDPLPTVVAREGDALPNGATLTALLAVANPAEGERLVAQRELPLVGQSFDVLRLDGVELVRGGDPLGNGQQELANSFGSQPRIASGVDGRYALLAQLVGGGVGLVTDGALLAQEGSPLDNTGPMVLEISPNSLTHTRSGQTCWLATLAQPSGPPQLHWMRDREVWFGPGTALAGSEISSLFSHATLRSRPVSPNGAHLLVHALLADGRRGLVLVDTEIGARLCGQPVPNSSGQAASLRVGGGQPRHEAPLALTALDLPSEVLGIFLGSPTSAVSQPPGASGRLCLGAPIVRLGPSPWSSGPSGVAVQTFEPTALPGGNSILSGETWWFQGWFRDRSPLPTSAFTDAVRVDFP